MHQWDSFVVDQGILHTESQLHGINLKLKNKNACLSSSNLSSPFVTNDSKSPYGSLDECLQIAMAQEEVNILASLQKRPLKKQRQEDFVPVVFAEIKCGDSTKLIKCLIDTGSTKTLLASSAVGTAKICKNKTTRQFNTIAGPTQSSEYTKLEFTLPEWSTSKKISWKTYLTPQIGNYDMIIGRDIMQELKMDVLYSSHQIKWDDQLIPLKLTSDLFSFYIRDESKAVQDATN